MATRQGSSERPPASLKVAGLPASAAASQPVAEAPADLKRQLLWRMGLAGLMILALLGALALFDYANAPDESLATGQQFSEPVPVRRKDPVPVIQPVRPAEDAVAKPPEAAAVALPETASGAAALPMQPPPAAPASAASPAPASVAPPLAVGAAAARSLPLVEPPPRPEVTAQPTLPPAARRLPDHAAAGQTLAAPATAARSGSGYVLQSATFVDPGRAEEWQAMLAQEGIPSTIEARLQIGPFSSRTEAEAARRKMNKLGLDTVGGLRKTRKP